MPQIHFFDVDNTITSSSTSVQYLFQGIRERFFPFSPLLAVPRLMAKYRTGELSVDRIFKQGIPFLRGKSRQDLEQLAEDVFRRRLKKQIYTGVLKLIRELQQAGKEVILATSAIDFIIAPLVKFLQVDTCISTSLKFEGDICTGIFSSLAFEEDKKRRVLDYLVGRTEVAADCFFYSDSIHDLPLLLAVGHPVVVNPDRKLKKEAARRNWETRFFTETLSG